MAVISRQTDSMIQDLLQTAYKIHSLSEDISVLIIVKDGSDPYILPTYKYGGHGELVDQASKGKVSFKNGRKKKIKMKKKESTFDTRSQECVSPDGASTNGPDEFQSLLTVIKDELLESEQEFPTNADHGDGMEIPADHSYCQNVPLALDVWDEDNKGQMAVKFEETELTEADLINDLTGLSDDSMMMETDEEDPHGDSNRAQSDNRTDINILKVSKIMDQLSSHATVSGYGVKERNRTSTNQQDIGSRFEQSVSSPKNVTSIPSKTAGVNKTDTSSSSKNDQETCIDTEISENNDEPPSSSKQTDHTKVSNPNSNASSDVTTTTKNTTQTTANHKSDSHAHNKSERNMTTSEDSVVDINTSRTKSTDQDTLMDSASSVDSGQAQAENKSDNNESQDTTCNEGPKSQNESINDKTTAVKTKKVQKRTLSICQYCGRTLLATAEHERFRCTANPDREYLCHDCRKVYPSEKALRQHKKDKKCQPVHFSLVVEPACDNKTDDDGGDSNVKRRGRPRNVANMTEVDTVVNYAISMRNESNSRCQRRDLRETDVPETSLGQAIHSEDEDEECDQPMTTNDMKMGPVDKPEGVIAEDIKRVKRGAMGKRQYISPQGKMAVLDYVSVHGLRPAARLFRIAPSTIRGWREQDLEAPHRPNGRITFTGRPSNGGKETDEQIFRWIQEQIKAQQKLTANKILAYAKTIITPINAGFKASPQWLKRFMNRHKLSFKVNIHPDSMKSDLVYI